MPAADLATLRARWRAEVPALENYIPLNHCSQAPPNNRTRSALDRYLASWSQKGMDWEGWVAEVELARAAFARLIDADPVDVAVATSVSQAVSSIAGALDYAAPRSEVLVDALEFPTVSQIWAAQRRRGARVRAIEAEGQHYDLDHVAASEQTALVSLTHGVYADGTLRNLEPVIEAAHDVGALVLVDAYQSLGTVPVSVQDLGVDVLVSGCLKYLLGLPGIAFAYVSPAVSKRLEPVATGWFGRQNPFAFSPELDWADGARRFDLGTPPIIEAYVARAGVEWLLEVGLDQVRSSTLSTSAALLDGGRALGLKVAGPAAADERTPMVALEVADATGVEAGLKEQGIIASARGSVIRLAPHFYTSDEDVERTLNALSKQLGR